jgi:transcription antitermination factor NusG
LEGIPGVLRNQNQGIYAECLALEDRVPLLDMSDAGTPITPGSWVRVRHPGIYNNDLALVLDFDDRTMDAEIAIVPRILLTSKRQRRPDASLFDREAVMQFYGRHTVEQRNQVLLFENREYKDGLLRRYVPWVDISNRNVNPTPSELELFNRCGDSFVVDSVNKQMVALQVDDRIEVIAGELRGLGGRLVDLGQHGIGTIRSDSAVDVQDIRTSELRKKFKLGDHVHVLLGEHRGAEGFIVEIDEESCVLYCRPSGLLYSTPHVPGSEVSDSLSLTKFCSSFSYRFVSNSLI